MVPTTGVAAPERLLRRLEWTVVRRLDGRLQGDYRTIFRGTGVDFRDLREYEPGDDLRHIDWNVTARTDVPFVREYTEDRELTAWLLLDRSASGCQLRTSWRSVLPSRAPSRRNCGISRCSAFKISLSWQRPLRCSRASAKRAAGQWVAVGGRWGERGAWRKCGEVLVNAGCRGVPCRPPGAPKSCHCDSFAWASSTVSRRGRPTSYMAAPKQEPRPGRWQEGGRPGRGWSALRCCN